MAVEWITNLFKNMDAKDWGNILSGVGDAYGAYKQGKVADSLVNLQKQDYAAEKKRQKESQARLDLAFSDHRYDSPSLPLN